MMDEDDELMRLRKLRDTLIDRSVIQERILSHFDAEGNILGNSQWRAIELWKLAKDLEAALDEACGYVRTDMETADSEELFCCGHCDYDESSGELIARCSSCQGEFNTYLSTRI